MSLHVCVCMCVCVLGLGCVKRPSQEEVIPNISIRASWKRKKRELEKEIWYFTFLTWLPTQTDVQENTYNFMIIEIIIFINNNHNNPFFSVCVLPHTQVFRLLLMLTGSQAELLLTAIVTAQRTELWRTSSSSRPAPRKSLLTTARYVHELQEILENRIHMSVLHMTLCVALWSATISAVFSPFILSQTHYKNGY